MFRSPVTIIMAWALALIVLNGFALAPGADAQQVQTLQQRDDQIKDAQETAKKWNERLFEIRRLIDHAKRVKGICEGLTPRAQAASDRAKAQIRQIQNQPGPNQAQRIRDLEGENQSLNNFINQCRTFIAQSDSHLGKLRPKEADAQTKANEAQAIVDNLLKQREAAAEKLKNHLNCYSVAASMSAFAHANIGTNPKPSDIAELVKQTAKAKIDREYKGGAGFGGTYGQGLTDERHAKLMGDAFNATGRAFFTRINQTIIQQTSNNPEFDDFVRAQLKSDWTEIQNKYDTALADARSKDNCDRLRDALNDAEKLFWRARGWRDLDPTQLALHQAVMPSMDPPKPE